jgi:hypothetical protein
MLFRVENEHIHTIYNAILGRERTHTHYLQNYLRARTNIYHMIYKAI